MNQPKHQKKIFFYLTFLFSFCRSSMICQSSGVEKSTNGDECLVLNVFSRNKLANAVLYSSSDPNFNYNSNLVRIYEPSYHNNQLERVVKVEIPKDFKTEDNFLSVLLVDEQGNNLFHRRFKNLRMGKLNLPNEKPLR